MKELNTLEEFFEFISQDAITVIDVYAEWCNPCQNFLKIGDRVEAALKEKNTIIAKVNFDDHREIADAFEVKNVPTFLYFKNGEIKSRYAGIKSIVQMVNIVDDINKGEGK